MVVKIMDKSIVLTLASLEAERIAQVLRKSKKVDCIKKAIEIESYLNTLYDDYPHGT